MVETAKEGDAASKKALKKAQKEAEKAAKKAAHKAERNAGKENQAGDVSWAFVTAISMTSFNLLDNGGFKWLAGQADSRRYKIILRECWWTQCVNLFEC